MDERHIFLDSATRNALKRIARNDNACVMIRHYAADNNTEGLRASIIIAFAMVGIKLQNIQAIELMHITLNTKIWSGMGGDWLKEVIADWDARNPRKS